ncbi:metallophosphoesterase [Gloeocapsopsis dulcis]|uniref:Metallophosphoesterase n=1 Tax=Gloeocapsopsis dulcis AAB1 = 1H9 TaxID=1433147 RepID=A0A6N8FTN5_9CHRO|nr:metallophosphoesterase [Gloeocapsopsis dulcis]MUL36463.1 metallophosphoesterase [Gloeocapsopsis dulcis AAB1 = 1H9]WNN87752.1 metallophosphoesterase [Gloeocapsopsis dulcis]
MPLKRRQFVFLSGISGFGLAFLSKIQNHSSDRNPNLNLVSQAQSLTSEPTLRFVSLADTGTGAKGQYAVAQAMTQYHKQNAFDLAILAGDNIYNDGEIEKIGAVFERPYEPLLQQGVKFRACLGNHDIRTANGDPQVKYPGFNMQGRYYTFRRDAVQFFALDTNNNADWKLQLPWLETELSRSDAPWKVVFGHHPIYSSGHYGTNQEFIKNLTPLFQKYNVQLYINGHDHNYERTRALNDITYLTCGAGAGVRPVGRSEWTEHSAEKLSFAAYEVYGDRIEISAIDTKNQVFDQGIVQYMG